MAVHTECTLTVGIADLQYAIAAVARYAEPPKQGDEQPITCRVRLAADKTHLVVSATDIRSSIAARVAILGDTRKGKFRKEDGPFIVDLLPAHARAVADSQTPNRLDGEDLGECTLALALDEVTITDSSGKYPGVSHTVVPLEQEATGTLPGTEDLGYPPIERFVGQCFARAMGVYKVFLPHPGSLTRLDAAAKGQPVVIEAVGDADQTAWLFWCENGRFAGQLSGRPEDDQQSRRRQSLRLEYLRWFGLVSGEDEARIALGGDVLGGAAAVDDDGFYDADNDPTEG
jgi:hypothetical protein